MTTRVDRIFGAILQLSTRERDDLDKKLKALAPVKAKDTTVPKPVFPEKTKPATPPEDPFVEPDAVPAQQTTQKFVAPPRGAEHLSAAKKVLAEREKSDD